MSKAKERRRQEAAAAAEPDPGATPTAAARETARLLVCVKEADDRYRAYWATRDPREQANMPRP